MAVHTHTEDHRHVLITIDSKSQLLISKLRHVNKNVNSKNKLDYVTLIETTVKAEDKIKRKT